jgi:hypothetical protein
MAAFIVTSHQMYKTDVIPWVLLRPLKALA